jgi:hypothetical protein
MDGQVLMSLALTLTLKQRRKKRAKWNKGWYLKRQSLSHVNLLKALHFEPSDWSDYLRMSKERYLELTKPVTAIIKKQDTNIFLKTLCFVAFGSYALYFSNKILYAFSLLTVL